MGRRIKRGIKLAALPALLAIAAPAGAGAVTTDVGIAMTDSPDPVAIGEVLTYSIAVTNFGPDTASAVTVSDDLSKKLDPVSATSTQGTCTINSRKVNCALGSLAPSEYTPTVPSATVTIAVRPNKVGGVTNTAKATLAPSDKETKPSNNSATVKTKVIAAPAASQPTCARQVATIIGTAGDDVLTGTAGPDVIKARGGNDTIRGITADDLVCAGAGDDVVRGGGGNDRLKGGAGNDLIKGGNGNDALNGGPGRDHCFGGPGRNTKRSC
jgi:uncharacterized repeat protein (TIGR01451 family)